MSTDHYSIGESPHGVGIQSPHLMLMGEEEEGLLGSMYAGADSSPYLKYYAEPDEGSEVMVESTAHGLSNGDEVKVSDTDSYDGEYTIEDVVTNSFRIPTPFTTKQNGDWVNKLTTVTSNAHGLSNGAEVEITGTTNYNGTYTISNVTANTFDIPAFFITDEATGTWTSTTKGPGIRFHDTAHGMTGTSVINVTGSTHYNGVHGITVNDANSFDDAITSFLGDDSGNWAELVSPFGSGNFTSVTDIGVSPSGSITAYAAESSSTGDDFVKDTRHNWSNVPDSQIVGRVRGLLDWTRPSDSKRFLVVVGWFNWTGDANKNRAVLWDGTSWEAMGTIPAGIGNLESAVADSDGWLVVTGSGQPYRWDGSTWTKIVASGDAPEGQLVLWNGELYGTFGASVMVYNRSSNTWSQLGSDFNATCEDLRVWNGMLITCGNFTEINDGPPDTTVYGIAKFSSGGSDWEAFDNSLGAHFGRAIGVWNNVLYYGSDAWSDQMRKWDGVSSWESILDSPGIGAHVLDIEPGVRENGFLLVSGSFGAVEGNNTGQVTRWNGVDTWEYYGSGSPHSGSNTYAVSEGPPVTS